MQQPQNTPKPPLPEKLDRFIKRLMGYKPPRDPRKEEKPIFASFQDRVVASVIDTALIYLILQDLFHFITMRVFGYVNVEAVQKARETNPQSDLLWERAESFFDGAWESGLAQLWLVNSFLQSAIIGVILVLMWNKFHCTPGKYLIGLEFAGRNGEGKPSLGRYMLRYLMFYITMPVFMIGFAYAGLDKKKRAIHDIIAGTTVIYSKRGSIFRQGWDAFKSAIKSLYHSVKK